MGVTVVTGRCGSGKSRYLMKRIESYIKDPFAKVIVIVPGALTFETERSIMTSCGAPGLLGLEVFSIQRLAMRILEDTAAHAFISSAEKAMICRRALTEVGEVYHGTAQQKDFESCLSELISQLKGHRAKPEALREAADKTRDEALRSTLNDTADVYEKYLEICAGRPDTADMYEMAAQQAPVAGFLRGAHVVIDGLDSYHPAVMRLLEAVMALAEDTTAAFRADADDPLFESERRDMRSLIGAAERCGQAVEEIALEADAPRHTAEELRFLEANLYTYPYGQYDGEPGDLRLYEAPSAAAEVDMICAGILGEVREGARFRDIAVVAGGVDGYAADIKAKFRAHGIPFFLDERRTLSDNTFFNFIQSALRAAAGDASSLPGVVFSRYAPIDEDERALLRGYTARYALRGWHFKDAFWRGENAAQAEAVRQKAMAPYFRLEDGVRAQSIEAQTSAVLRFLRDCDAQSKLETLRQELTKSAEAFAGEAEYFAQVYAKTTEVLAALPMAYAGKPVPPALLPGLFAAGCDAVKIAVIPPTADEVGVFDISLARLKNVKTLFAAGVQDGVWPAGGDAPGIFSQGEREQLTSLGVDIGGYDLSAEKLKVYTALVKPSARLHVSYNTESGAPSVLIDRLRRIFPGLETQRDVLPAASAERMPPAMLAEMAAHIKGQEMDAQPLEICAQFAQDESWVKTAKSILLRTNEAQPLPPEDAGKLYGGMRCSATRIETYYKCPFRHFMDHGIRAQIARDYLGDSLDTGTFMHLALDLFARRLLEDSADIRDLNETQTSERMRAAVGEAAASHENGKLADDERLVLQRLLLEDELVNTALRIRKHFIGADARIEMSEQPFADFTVETAFGDAVISGKIDRIDTAGGYFRVVDYKSSNTFFHLKDMMGGVSLQLPVYIDAARRLLQSKGMPHMPAGGYYMKIGDAYKQSEGDIAKAARMMGISLCDPDALVQMSAVDEKGSFVAIDQAVTKAGALHGRAKDKFFTPAQLEALLETARNLIRDAAKEVYSGSTDIRPTTGMSGGDACVYCAYGAVCMFSDGYDGNETREIPPADKSQLGGGDADG